MKRCTKCGGLLELDQFTIRKDGSMFGKCKTCQREYHAEWVKNNPDKAKASRRRYSQKNREAVNARHRRYRAENRERFRDIDKRHNDATKDYRHQHYLVNRDKARARNKAHYEKHRHFYREYGWCRRNGIVPPKIEEFYDESYVARTTPPDPRD